MFKGPTQDIDAIYTAPTSAVCGVTLDTNGKKEYLITGIMFASSPNMCFNICNVAQNGSVCPLFDV